MIECKLCHKFYKSVTNTHLKSKHNTTTDEYLEMFPGSVMSNKQGKTYEEIYGEEGAARLKDKLHASHVGQRSWSKNLTKETDVRVAAAGRKISVSLKKYHEKGGTVWNKNLTKETDPRVAKQGVEPGTKFTEEHIQHMRKPKSKKCSEETKQKMRHPKTEEHRAHMRGPRPHTWGPRPHTRGPRPYMRGENASNWQGGISENPYPEEFVRVRKEIKVRDGYQCQLCGKIEMDEKKQLGRGLTIHHIDYDKQNCNSINLITLCCSCNAKANFNREYWTNFFQMKLKISVRGEKYAHKET